MRSKIGKRGEDIALKYLKKHKYKILDRNYRCRFGEIDIIARDRDTLVFIEVKLRRCRDYGTPESAVDERKRRKIERVALDYMMKNDLRDRDIRFDVVAIDMGDKKEDIRLIRNAFEP